MLDQRLDLMVMCLIKLVCLKVVVDLLLLQALMKFIDLYEQTINLFLSFGL